MIRRILAILLIVLGLGAAGAGIGSATIWKPPTTVTVPLPQTPDVSYIITDPGVLGIVNPTVRVHATAESADVPVVIAIGRTSEMTAWLEPSDHWRLTGLQSWEALTHQAVDAVVDPEAEPADADAEDEVDPNPAGSDMWVEEINGLGEVTYVWEEVPGDWSMLIASDGTHPAPSLELTWEREVPTPALVPGVIAGSVLFLAGAALLVWALLARRTREPVVVAAAPDGDSEADDSGLPSTSEIMAGLEEHARAAAETETDPFIPVVGAEEPHTPYPHQFEEDEAAEDEAQRPLTRRELRDRERAKERAKALGVADPMDTGPIPWPTQETPIVGTGELNAAEIRESISADRSGRVDEVAGTGEIPLPEAPTDTSGPIAAPPLRARKRRGFWGRRKDDAKDTAPQGPTPPDLPFEIDEETAEMLRTGEIDLSALNPQASGASWRASWGLGADARGPWVPIEKRTTEPTDTDTDTDADRDTDTEGRDR